MMKLRWKKEWLDFERITWSGTENQCSRQLSFSLAWNPYDKDFNNPKIDLGDLIAFYDGKELLYVGTVTSREKKAEIGSVEYNSMDFMHHLLRSNATYKFKNTTPEKIAKKVCADLNIGTTNLAVTNTKIEKMFFENKCIYDILLAGYRKAKANTGKKYMPVMSGKKVSVIEKGIPSGVTLSQGKDITSASYSDTTDNMVNLVQIFNDNLKKIGEVSNKKQVNKYGVYQQVYEKEDGVNAKRAAKALMVGITKEANVEAIGDIRAVAGRSIMIKDSATGLSGKFYITDDSHSFENGIHTMSLGLSWDIAMEEGAESVEENGKNDIRNASVCYYLDGSYYYHSKKECVACKGKKVKKSTVADMKKIKITSGKNKGKRRYKACSKCWNT